MREIKVVIGKNFGDEGKGQTVSDLCKGASALVVRHNGGAQAGHTVEEDGFRFVFHQIGSGSLWGAPTYWSGTFLPDLLKLGEEAWAYGEAAAKLYRNAFLPTVYAHPDCACTLVYDVLLNSLAEILRGEEKHGSCGMGIYEAVLRSRNREYRLCLKDFTVTAKEDFVCEKRTRRIVDKLKFIRQEYVSERLEMLREEFSSRLGEQKIQDWIELIWDDNVLYNSAEEMCENFDRYVRIADWTELFERYDRIVFENGQGLLLDEDNREYYPHLTPSHTGLYNVVALMEEYQRRHQKAPSDVLPLEVIYVTRTYVTRHGAGRLDCECAKEDICPDMEDRTNVPNPWQDSLRYAKHPSVNAFFRPVLQDLNLFRKSRLAKYFPFHAVIHLTHLDETGGRILFADGDKSVGELEKLQTEIIGG